MQVRSRTAKPAGQDRGHEYFGSVGHCKPCGCCQRIAKLQVRGDVAGYSCEQHGQPGRPAAPQQMDVNRCIGQPDRGDPLRGPGKDKAECGKHEETGANHQQFGQKRRQAMAFSP